MADRTEDTDLPPFEAEFARAWDTPGHTRYQLPDTDVNAVLATRYATGEPLTLTRGMLWDMEVRKAAYPGSYIPYVVRAGSDRSWNRHRGKSGGRLSPVPLEPLRRRHWPASQAQTWTLEGDDDSGRDRGA